MKALVTLCLLPVLWWSVGCMQSVSTGGKAPFIEPNCKPLPEVFLDFDLATLKVEIENSVSSDPVRVGDLFGLVFQGAPQADYRVELADYVLQQQMPSEPLIGTHVSFEIQITVRLKTAEGLERVLTGRGRGGDTSKNTPEYSVREAACRAVENLAAKVRYQIAPVE